MDQISEDFLDLVRDLRFRDGVEINDYFVQRKGEVYIDCFQATVADKDAWGGLATRKPSLARQNFLSIWGCVPQMFGAEGVNFIELVTLMSVIIHETGGEVRPISEKFGNSEHPGISYLFDKIPELNKRSYNTAPGNRTWPMIGVQCYPALSGEARAIGLSLCSLNNSCNLQTPKSRSRRF